MAKERVRKKKRPRKERRKRGEWKRKLKGKRESKYFKKLSIDQLILGFKVNLRAEVLTLDTRGNLLDREMLRISRLVRKQMKWMKSIKHRMTKS